MSLPSFTFSHDKKFLLKKTNRADIKLLSKVIPRLLFLSFSFLRCHFLSQSHMFCFSISPLHPHPHMHLLHTYCTISLTFKWFFSEASLPAADVIKESEKAGCFEDKFLFNVDLNPYFAKLTI